MDRREQRQGSFASSSSSMRSPSPNQAPSVSSPIPSSGRQRTFSRSTARSDSPWTASIKRSTSSLLAEEDRDGGGHSPGQFDSQPSPSPLAQRSPGTPYTMSSKPMTWRRPSTASSITTSRRPSSPSASQVGGGYVRGDRRMSNDSSSFSIFASAAPSPTSLPSTPKTRNLSSRSKILASTANALEGSPPWQSSRIGESSQEGGNLSIYSATRQATSPGPSSMSVGTSIKERKRRLNNVSGGYFDDGMTDSSSLSGRSTLANVRQVQSDQASTLSSTSNPSGGSHEQKRSQQGEETGSPSAVVRPPLPSTKSMPSTEARLSESKSLGLVASVDEHQHASSSSSSFRNKLFGLRRDKKVSKDDDTMSIKAGRDVTSTSVGAASEREARDTLRSARTASNGDKPVSNVARLREAHYNAMRAGEEKKNRQAVYSRSLSTSSNDFEDEERRLGSPAELSAEVLAQSDNDGASIYSQRGTLRQTGSYTSGNRMPTDYGQESREQTLRKRANSRGSASIRSVASFGSHVSTTSVPTRTTSLKQIRANANAASNANFGSHSAVAPLASPTASSYKSVPPSPLVASTFSHEEGNNSGANSPSQRASWRHSTLSTAAGPSGAGALAAIRARFGEPTSADASAADGSQRLQSDLPQSWSSAAMRLNDDEEAANDEDLERNTRNEGTSETKDEERFESLSPNREDLLTLSRPSSPPGPKMEPLRPVKSPLRVARTSAEGSNKLGGVGLSITPSTSSTSAGVRLEDRIRSHAGAHEPLSPPRKSLEEMGLGSAVYTGPRLYSHESIARLTPSISQTSLRSQQDSASLRIADGTDPAASVSMPSANASTLSFTTDDGTYSGHAMSSKQSSGDGKEGKHAKRYNTLRRVTPPALFGIKSQGRHASANDTSSVDVRHRVASAEAIPADDSPYTNVASGQRKKSIWRLGMGKGDSQASDAIPPPLPGNTSSATSALSTSKSGRLTIRGRKSDPHVPRLPIRRVFDHDEVASSPGTPASIESGDKSTIEAGDSIPRLDQSFHTNSASTSRESLPKAKANGAESGSRLQHSMLPSKSETQSSEQLPSHLKQFVRRNNAIRELIETERSYASDLAVVRDVYLARAKQLAGVPVSSPLQTPMTNHGTPTMPSPAIGTPSSAPPNIFGYGPSIKGTPPMHFSGARSVRHQASSEAPLSSASFTAHGSSNISAASAASSVNPSNRSSTYTTSSQTSSEMSFQWPPPNGSSLPGTPSVGAGSSTHKSVVVGASSPVPSLQQLKGAGAGNLTKLQTGSVLTTPTNVAADAPMSASDMRIIFAHLESCHALALESAEVMRMAVNSVDLESAGGDGKREMKDREEDRIGQAFLILMPRIEVVYTAYCSRHEASMQRLQELTASSPRAVSFLRECTEVARKLTNAWDLGSLLIKPVQRVLKYPLLLRQILNATQTSHPDHANLVEALHKMQSVADKINQVKRRRDLADFLITGRDRDGKALAPPSSASTTPKGKKKPRSSNPNSSAAGAEEMLLTDDELILAAEEYSEIIKRFEALQSRVAIFGRQCGVWSHSLRECYYAQLRIMGSLRRIYALRAVEDDVVSTRTHAPVGPEDETVAAFMTILKTIINRSWRQMDSEIRSAIIPMTMKIETMFDAPQSVILKRDEREADFIRCRQVLSQQDTTSTKALDRRMIESANGFVALQAQLIDELPTFVQGVQLLLDVGVQAFARLQAAHLDEVRNLTLEFWSGPAGHGNEVEMVGLDDDETLNVGPTLRHINPVRAFWESHRVFSQWSDTLTIARRDSELSFVGDSSEAGQSSTNVASTATLTHPTSTPAGSVAHEDMGIFTSPFANSTKISESKVLPAPPPKRSHVPPPAGSSSHGHGGSSSSTHVVNDPSGGLASNTGRRPSGGGVAGLMRTLSGTFSRENTPSPNVDVVPPMPADAASNVRMHRHSPVNATGIPSVAPSLPGLVFREDGLDGFFIENTPIEFLDKAQKEPYGGSPAIRPAGTDMVEVGSISGLSSPDEEDNSTHTTSFFSVSSANDGQTSGGGGGGGIVQGSGESGKPSIRSTTDSSNSLGVPRVPSKMPQRHKIKTLFQSIAVEDANKEREGTNHLGWPFLLYSSGDAFRVLSSHIDHSSDKILLFGRLDRTGELGWVDKADFSSVERAV